MRETAEKLRTGSAPVWTLWVALGYLSVVLIWGTTWFAIQTQINGTAPHLAVGLRMALASSIFFLLAIANGVSLRLTRRLAGSVLVHGLCFFGFNYVAVYEGSQYMTSGVVAVVFSVSVPFNIVAEWVLMGTRPRLSSWLAAAVGMFGVALVFSAELETALLIDGVLGGAALVVLAAALVSVGNVLSARLVSGEMTSIGLNAYGMAVGTAAILFWGVVSNADWTLEITPTWLMGYSYLVLIGSVLAFWIYMRILPSIGPLAGAYVVVLSPVVALCISGALEGLQLGVAVVVGAVLLLLGNSILVLRKR